MQRLQALLRATSDILYDWDIERGVLWTSADHAWPDAAAAARAWSEEAWARQIPGTERERIVLERRQALNGGAQTWAAEYHYAPGGGPVVHVRDRAYIVRSPTGAPLRMIGALTDVDGRKLIEDVQRSLARVARLTALGELTASIVHEISQPLGAILNNAEAGLQLLASGKGHVADLGPILEDVRHDDRRAIDLIRRLRDLLQGRELRREPLDVNKLVLDTVQLVHTDLLRRCTQLETRFDAVPYIQGDRTHLQQVLINLILNSMDALSATAETQRRIAIRTTRFDANHVRVSVVDNGCGIAPENLTRIFESFYTDKTQGLGLGLAISRSIIDAHGGRMWATANPEGAGAALHFELACDAAHSPAPQT